MVLREMKKHKGLLVLVFSGLVICLISGTALAGYIQSALLGGYTASAEDDFYFTSDLLREGSVPAYELYQDWGTENMATIRIKLKNYENALNVTDGAISYNVSDSVSGGGASGIIPGGSGEQEETVVLTIPRPEDINEPLEVTVTVSAASPYEKILKGRFIIRPAISYEMAENANLPVATLVVNLAKSEETSRDVVISWPAGASPDMTDPIVTGAVSLDLENRSLTARLNTASAYALVFFKDATAENYTGVTVSGA